MVLEKTLESPLDCKEINQSILKEISPRITLEGMILKLKLQYFGHLMQKVDSLEKTLMLGGIAGRFFTSDPCSVQFSHSVVSDSLRPHESQHIRPSCPSPTPRVHSDSRPLSQ